MDGDVVMVDGSEGEVGEVEIRRAVRPLQRRGETSRLAVTVRVGDAEGRLSGRSGGGQGEQTTSSRV